jgi:hypothetical protein
VQPEPRSGSKSDAAGPGLDPRLAGLLAVLPIHTPTLRERPGAAEALARQLAGAWTHTRGLPARHFAEDALEALRNHPWPGNLRELEAVVVRTLSANRSDPIRAVQLRFDAPGEWGQRGSAAAASEPAARGEQAPPEEPAVPPAEQTIPAEPSPLGLRAEWLGPDSPGQQAAPAGGAGAATAGPERGATEPDDPARTPTGPEPLGFDAEALALDQWPDGPPAAEPADAAAGPPLREPAATPRAKPVDVAALLDGLLDALRDRIQSRKLLVLKELDRAEPFALGDPEALRRVFSDVLSHALASIPDRGDMYLASSHHPAGLEGRPSVRVLLRFRKPGPDDRASFDPAALATESADILFARAQQLVTAQGGVFTGDAADPRETLVVVDLRAPGPSPEA